MIGIISFLSLAAWNVAQMGQKADECHELNIAEQQHRNLTGSCISRDLPFPGPDYMCRWNESHLVYATAIWEFLFIFVELNPMLKSNETDFVIIVQEARNAKGIE